MDKSDYKLLNEFKKFTCGVTDDEKIFTCVYDADNDIYTNFNYKYEDDDNFEEHYSSGTEILNTGESLSSNGEFLMSQNGEYRFLIESDSKIYILPTGGGASWSAGQSITSKENLPYKLFIDNGKLNLVNNKNISIMTVNINKATRIELDNDGVLIGYNNNGEKVWRSND
jgi:hypothetical protein